MFNFRQGPDVVIFGQFVSDLWWGCDSSFQEFAEIQGFDFSIVNDLNSIFETRWLSEFNSLNNHNAQNNIIQILFCSKFLTPSRFIRVNIFMQTKLNSTPPTNFPQSVKIHPKESSLQKKRK